VATESTACWACGSPRTKLRKQRGLPRPLSSEDLRITDSRYGTTLALRECRDCGFLFADDAELPRLPALYAALEDPEYESDQPSRAMQMRWLVERCLDRKPQAVTLLDVGAANGVLVEQASRFGLGAVGVEPSAQLAAAARARGVNVLEGTLPHPALEDRRFDFVVVVDVIEHVADPVGLLRAAAARLAPDGFLVVVTPNVASAAARVLGDQWWHFRVAHVGYFSPKSFGRAARRAGLRVVSRQQARWFFPVSYLGDRISHYLPTAIIGKLLHETDLGRRIGSAVVPLNLFDSSVFFVQGLGGS
jgi:2-polyprenyl-3-methyl-5-hydroxy-6-metoxy-1,4-benzoquinol methylase